MESKFLVSFLILGLISTVLAKGGGHRRHDDDRHHHDDHDRKCFPPLTPELPMKCTVSPDCSTFSCSADVEGESISLTLKIDGSKEPLTAEITLKVPSKEFDWSHSFKNGEKIQVPGFPLNIKGLVGADMYLVVYMYKGDGGVGFKVDLNLKTSVPSEGVVVHLLRGKIPPPMDMDDDYPEPHDHHRWGKCSKFAWWFKRQSKPVKASIIISAILVIALLIAGIVYCCKKRRNGKQVKVMPPSYAEATETKVPLEKLVNEE